MLNPVQSLDTVVSSLGKAYIYVATDPTSAASWSLLGLTEGDVQIEEKWTYNDFKLPEWTGDAVHSRLVEGVEMTVVAPLIWGDSNLYDKLSPIGVAGGGRTRPIAAATKTVLIIPVKEVGDSGIQYDGTAWTPTAPKHAVWIHKATFEPGNYAFRHTDGGKVLRSISFKSMFDDTKPEGQKLYTIGDPIAKGITTYRV